jgi:GNAT superfamily N-acetyltransferase
MDNVVKYKELGNIIIAYRTGIPVGTIQLIHFKETPQGEIGSLFVEKQYRDLGIEKQLIREALHKAKKDGLLEVKAIRVCKGKRNDTFGEVEGFVITKAKTWSFVLK